MEPFNVIRYLLTLEMANSLDINETKVLENIDRIKIFLRKSDTVSNNNLLKAVCRLGQLKLLKILAKTCRININNLVDGYTPLIYASMYNHNDCIKYLYHAGANVFLTDAFYGLDAEFYCPDERGRYFLRNWKNLENNKRIVWWSLTKSKFGPKIYKWLLKNVHIF